jgi:hypothetical protein
MIDFILTIVIYYLIGMIPAIMWIRMYNHFKHYWARLSGDLVWFSWLAVVIVIINILADIFSYVVNSDIWDKISRFFDKLVGK